MARSELVDLVHGCTFDDLLFAPQLGVVTRRDPARIDLASRLSTNLVLKRPLVSAKKVERGNSCAFHATMPKENNSWPC